MSIPRLDLDQAIANIRSELTPVGEIERVNISAALNRIVAQPLAAPLSLPPFASSAMDGYAYNASTSNPALPLPVVGTALAGHPFSGAIQPQQCIRITTGAPVPSSADTVVIQEDTRLTDDQLNIAVIPARGDNIRAIGHDVLQGEQLVSSGSRINAFRLSWLAACGFAKVPVYRRPRVTFFSTGDELVAPGAPLAAGQIYDSNRFLIQALLSPLAVELTDGGSLPDEPDALRAALADATADLIITSGGVSVGDADYLTDIVREDGSLHFWRLNLKPGKPLAFGKLGKSWFLGLPGNPVSSAVTCLLLARPIIAVLGGANPEPALQMPAVLTTAIRHRPGREEFQRGTLSTNPTHISVAVTGDQSSNRLSSFSEANCLIRIAKDRSDCNIGELVDVLPFKGLI